MINASGRCRSWHEGADPGTVCIDRNGVRVVSLRSIIRVPAGFENRPHAWMVPCCRFKTRTGPVLPNEDSRRLNPQRTGHQLGFASWCVFLVAYEAKQSTHSIHVLWCCARMNAVFVEAFPVPRPGRHRQGPSSRPASFSSSAGGGSSWDCRRYILAYSPSRRIRTSWGPCSMSFPRWSTKIRSQ